MPRIYSSAVTPALTQGEYQMSELTACDYSESFTGDVAAYILQNVDLDDLGLILCEDDNRGDIRIPSRGGGGRRIVCDSAALQRLSGELNGIRDSLAQASQEVGSAAGKLMGGFVGAARFRSSIRRNAARLEQLEQSAGQLASALSELAALYQQTEARVSSAG